jgi:hypothetical protein
MASWATTSQIVNNLLTGAYTNSSSYPIPAAIYEGAANDIFQEASFGPDESGVKAGYNFSGIKASGTVALVDPEADTPTRYAVEGATIQTKQDGRTFTATPDPSTGEYSLPVADAGDYEITASHPLLKSHTRTLTFQSGQSRPGETFELEPPSGGGGLIVGGPFG